MNNPIKVILGMLTGLHLLSAAAFAQATIAGVVRDSSGAVLPGVTVEATSPALTEKVRTAVTDGTGQYRIVTPPPGRRPARERVRPSSPCVPGAGPSAASPE